MEFLSELVKTMEFSTQGMLDIIITKDGFTYV